MAADAHRALKQDEDANQSLLQAVLARDNLKRAYKRVRSNTGGPGIDGVRVEDFREHARRHWWQVQQQIEQGRYKPQPVKRVEIPKADGGKRLLGVPTVMDRVIQQAIAQVLRPILDARFSASSFGFRPGRNAHQAIRQVQGYVRWTDKAQARFKHRIKELSDRSWGVSMRQRYKELGAYLRGWMGYFGISVPWRVIEPLDEWIRRRIRMC
jgi:retron-type reverse transcriptase